MPDTTQPSEMSVDEFLDYGSEVKWSELVRGQLRVYEPASGMHGLVVVELVTALKQFVTARGIGVVFSEGTGFRLPNLHETVRSPDAAFVRADQVPSGGFGAGFPRIAPELVAEVLSRNDRAWAFDEKLCDYFDAGVRTVWVVNPRRRRVSIYRNDASTRWLREEDTLEGEGILSGFSMPIARLFQQVARET